MKNGIENTIMKSCAFRARNLVSFSVTLLALPLLSHSRDGRIRRGRRREYIRRHRRSSFPRCRRISMLRWWWCRLCRSRRAIQVIQIVACCRWNANGVIVIRLVRSKRDSWVLLKSIGSFAGFHSVDERAQGASGRRVSSVPRIGVAKYTT